MKKTLVILMLILTAIGASAQGVDFVKGVSFKEALAKARKENKMLFMDCYTSWCVPCARMAHEIFPQKVCGDYFNDKFVCIQVDMEKGEGVQLLKKYMVQSYPTFIIMDADGKEINRLTGGSPDAATFLTRMVEAVKPDNSVVALKEAFDKEPNYDNGMKLAKAQIDHGQDPTPTLDEMYKNPWESQRYSREYLELVFATTDFRSPRFDHLMLDKYKMDKYLGREVVNQMIFDTYRKPMYLVADERPNNYTVDDVRKAAFITAMLELPIDDAESYLPRVALYVMEKDYDTMIRFYEQTVRYLPGNDAFKGILEGILLSKYKKMNTAQQKKVMDYLKKCADTSTYESKSKQEAINSLINQK